MNEEILEIVAPTLVVLALILTTGGVLVVRPLVKRLAELLHAMTQERLAAPPQKQTDQLLDLLSSMDRRLGLLEERQNFAESLLTSRELYGQLPEGYRSSPSSPPQA